MTDMSALARASLAGEALSRADAFTVLQAPRHRAAGASRRSLQRP